MAVNLSTLIIGHCATWRHISSHAASHTNHWICAHRGELVIWALNTEETSAEYVAIASNNAIRRYLDAIVNEHIVGNGDIMHDITAVSDSSFTSWKRTMHNRILSDAISIANDDNATGHFVTFPFTPSANICARVQSVFITNDWIPRYSHRVLNHVNISNGTSVVNHHITTNLAPITNNRVVFDDRVRGNGGAAFDCYPHSHNAKRTNFYSCVNISRWINDAWWVYRPFLQCCIHGNAARTWWRCLLGLCIIAHNIGLEARVPRAPWIPQRYTSVEQR